mgnify:CR=1 FL=1
MEIFIVIALVLTVFALWGIKSGITDIQNSLFNIDSNLDSLNDKFNPPESDPYEE